MVQRIPIGLQSGTWPKIKQAICHYYSTVTTEKPSVTLQEYFSNHVILMSTRKRRSHNLIKNTKEKEQLLSVTRSVFSTIQNILVKKNTSEAFTILNFSSGQEVSKAPPYPNIWPCYPMSLQGIEEGKHLQFIQVHTVKHILFNKEPNISEKVSLGSTPSAQRLASTVFRRELNLTALVSHTHLAVIRKPQRELCNIITPLLNGFCKQNSDWRHHNAKAHHISVLVHTRFNHSHYLASWG